MTEAQISGKIIAEVKRVIPGAIVFKHNDMSTKGIPDISVTLNGRTIWIEVKYIRLGESDSRQRKHFDPLQLQRALQLELQGRCLYFIAYHLDNGLPHGVIIAPSELQLQLVLERPMMTNVVTTFTSNSYHLKSAVEFLARYLKETT